MNKPADKDTIGGLSHSEQQAIVETLSHQSGTYNEDARRILGSPLGYVEGRPLTQLEIVASVMAPGSPEINDLISANTQPIPG